jgi:hypothetical protein
MELEGVWGLVASHSWDEEGTPLQPPVGSEISFSKNRILVVRWQAMKTTVDVALRPDWTESIQVRDDSWKKIRCACALR